MSKKNNPRWNGRTVLRVLAESLGRIAAMAVGIEIAVHLFHAHC